MKGRLLTRLLNSGIADFAAACVVVVAGLLAARLVAGF